VQSAEQYPPLEVAGFSETQGSSVGLGSRRVSTTPSEGDDEDKTTYANVVYEGGDREDVDFNELSDIILSKTEERVYLNLHDKPAFGK